MYIEIVNKIQAKYNEVKRVYSEENPYNLSPLTKEIIDLVILLEKYDSKYKNFCSQAHAGLIHTLNKEVNWAEDAYKAAKNKKAPYKRSEEYYSELSNAIDKIGNDLVGIVS